MGWTPVADLVTPGIGAGLNGPKAVVAVVVGQHATTAAKIRIDGGQILIFLWR